MARSQYLKISVRWSVLNVGSNGLLTEDTRSNQEGTDDDAYTAEGIYTFTVKNEFTNETTTKTIYVGTDKYILALAQNALTVEAINEKISQGAVVNEDGTITGYDPEPKQAPVAPDRSEPQAVSPDPVAAEPEANAPLPGKFVPVVDEFLQSDLAWRPVIGVFAAAVCLLGIRAAVRRCRRRKSEDRS